MAEKIKKNWWPRGAAATLDEWTWTPGSKKASGVLFGGCLGAGCRKIQQRAMIALRSMKGVCRSIFRHTSPRPLISTRTFSSTDSEQNAKERAYKILSVSRKGLLKHDYSKPEEGVKKPSSPLVDEIKRTIGVLGPISVADWMKQCLGNPDHGYYMRKDLDVFGKEGDFVTSPEISQIFGELLGLWCVSTWMAMGKPQRIRLVECGPGRGTLMRDVLRILKRFPDMRAACKAVHFVENSPKMRKQQADKLGVRVFDEIAEESGQVDEAGRMSDNMLVRWHWDVRDIPKDDPILLIANEFFDALPIHQFQYTRERGWQERLIDLDNSSDTADHFRWVLSSTPAVANYTPKHLLPSPQKGTDSAN